jgi:tRNA (adenine22-N1)-methyltransferase
MATVLNIDKRLESIVELCPTVKKIADIGCDHGYVTCELVLEDKAQMVIATEKSAECLNKAVSLADAINITPFISFRQGDGFEPITKYDKINFAIIAGMGGAEIIKILKKKPKRLYDFVLQPMSDVILLRQYLIENKFNIVVDKLVKEGDKFYNVIRVTKGRCKPLADLELYFGKTNFTENYEVFYEYLTKQQKKLMDFKAEIGGLSNKLQQELDYVNSAIGLFESAAEQENSAQKK